MKFYVDENVHSAIVSGLEERGFDIKYVAEEGSGLSDEAHLEIADRQGRVIITSDEDFLKLDQGFDHNGVIFLTDQEMPIGEAIRQIGRISSKIKQRQFRNHIEFL